MRGLDAATSFSPGRRRCAAATATVFVAVADGGFGRSDALGVEEGAVGVGGADFVEVGAELGEFLVHALALVSAPSKALPTASMASRRPSGGPRALDRIWRFARRRR